MQWIQAFEQITSYRLSESQRRAFTIFEAELLHWNSKYNLTAIRDPVEIRSKHFLDSLSCALVMEKRPVEHLIDIGTGAGFPGIPLKILFPDMHLTLLDSIGKKIEFCRHIIQMLNLENVNLLVGRAEDIGHDSEHRERYDWAVARAVAGLPILAEYLLPFVRVGGTALAQKGASALDEIQKAGPAISKLGGQFLQALKVNLPTISEERYLVVMTKISPTPATFPRRTGIPEKRPLR